MNNNSTSTCILENDDQNLSDAEIAEEFRLLQSALDTPVLYTRFRDIKAQSKVEIVKTGRQLAALFRKTVAADKEELPWIKGGTFGDKRSEKNSLRTDANVKTITCIEADYDVKVAGKVLSFDEMQALLRKAGIGCVVSTSFSHSPEKPNVHIYCPLSSPCAPEMRLVYSAWLNGAVGGVLDPISHTLSQGFYFGGKEGNTHAQTIEIEGAHIDRLPMLAKGAIGRDRKPLEMAKDGKPVKRSESVDEAECLALIESGQSYNEPISALTGSWARKGKMSADQALKRLTKAMGRVPKEKRTPERWGKRMEDLPRTVRNLFSKEEQARAERNASQTEFQFARDFVALHHEALKFHYPSDSWFQFSPTGWREIPHDSVVHIAAGLLEKLSPGNRKTNTRAMANSIAYLARGNPLMTVLDADYWDQKKTLLATPRGVIDLEKGVVRAARPADLCTKVTLSSLPEGYDPDLGWDAWCPLWVKFMDEACQGDSGKVRLLQQYLGLALSGITDPQKFLFIYGEGNNGKGVMMNVAQRIMGEGYVRVTSPDVLMASKFERHKEIIARLRGARLVLASEVQAGMRWNEELLKRMTAGDSETANEMRQNSITFRHTGKLLMSGNNKPIITNLDAALKRRIVMLGFNNVPPVPDLKLEEKLMGEDGGILAWKLAGFHDWQKNGLVIPEIASVNVVEIAVLFLVSTDHAAALAIWVFVVSAAGGINSAIASVCM